MLLQKELNIIVMINYDIKKNKKKNFKDLFYF